MVQLGFKCILMNIAILNASEQHKLTWQTAVMQVESRSGQGSEVKEVERIDPGRQLGTELSELGSFQRC